MVLFTFGKGRELLILWPSAAKSCHISPSLLKVINRKKVRIPKPPNHWMSARQKMIDKGMDSSPVKTVMPVVVKPLTDSKKASMKDFPKENIKGNPPTIDMPIQAMAHISMLVTKLSFLGEFLVK